MKMRKKKIPIEGYLKILLSIIGMIGEIAYAGGNFVTANRGNGQHVTMYMAFAISGLVDVLSIGSKLPPNTDYIGLILAVTIECIVFKFHLHERKPLDVFVHTCLIYVMMALIVTLLFEIHFRESLHIYLVRCFFVILQGTWFIQIAFVLHDPRKGVKKLDQNDAGVTMMVVMFFAWHICSIFLVLLFYNLIMQRIFRKEFGQNYSILSDNETMTFEYETDGV